MSEVDKPENSASVPSGTVIAGRYRVDRLLGAGGMGEVYLVQHTKTDEKLAMKVLLSTVISDQTALERFQREARTPARIDSDHVVKVVDADVADELKGAPFLVMEYLRGEDLDRYLERHGPMPARDVVNYLRQVARALDKAHALGIVHRDLKPENIFITYREDGTPHLKILDFGIAKFTSAAGDLVHKTATSPGQIYGTPLYMSPEQAKGESKRISPQTDIWALGLIANRMLSARDYWNAETLTALIAQVVYEPMQRPSEKQFDFGAGYDEWFLRCCNREPDARYSTAGEAIFKLGQALGVIDQDATFQVGAPSSVQVVPPPTSGRSNSEPSHLGGRPLSKTELQLAQTGVASNGRSDRGTFVKVAVGALIVGAAFTTLWFGLRDGGRPDRTAARPTADVRRPPPPGTARGTQDLSPKVAPVTSGSADVEPAASATPVDSSGAPPAASSSADVPSPKVPQGPRPPRPKSSSTPKDPTTEPPKPPKPENPLDTRT